jgi:hypothetical protein
MGGDRRILSLETFTTVLGLNTVRKCIKDLEDRDNNFLFRNKIGTSYVSNILKLRIKYQIITYSFISRPDLSHSVKAFIIKVIMLGKKFQTSATLPLLLKKLVYREGFKPNSGRLRFQGILDSAIGEGFRS